VRSLFVLAAVAGVIWYAVQGFSGKRDGGGILSSVVSAAAEKTLPSPGDGVVPQRPQEPLKDSPAQAASPSSPAPSSFFAQSQFQPAIPVPLEPDVVKVYRFTDRAVPDLQSLAGLGVAVMSDPSTRTVTVKGKQADVDAAYSALTALDLSSNSANVRTWAVYVDRSQSRGWDLTAAIQAIASADVGFEIGAGRASLNLNGDEISAALDVIADGSAVDVIQRPHLTLLDGQVAEVETTSEVPLPTISVSGNGVSQSGITFRKVGLRLTVRPQFLGRGRVRLVVEQENGLIGATVDLGQGLRAPVIETQRVASSVEIAIGQAVVLGGVSSDRLTARKGFLRDTTERQSGFLYVILSTSEDAPRAYSPGNPLASPFPGVPFAEPFTPGDVMLGEEFPLLPRKGLIRASSK